MLRMLPLFFLLVSPYQELKCQEHGTSRNEGSVIKCYFFFTADCPASRNNLPKMEDAQQLFKKQGLRVIGVVSDPRPDLHKLQETLETFGVTFEIQIDSTLRIAKEHGATTTPQVFLYSSNNSLLYSGLVDDYYESLGRHRKIIKNHFLTKAIRSHLSNEDIAVKSTKPIGCRINFDLLR